MRGHGTDGSDKSEFLELTDAEHSGGTEEPFMIVEVAYDDDKCLSIPAGFSQQLYQRLQKGEHGN